MKNIILILLTTLTLYSHDQWIQVFSGEVVEQRFLQAISNNDYESIVIHEHNKSIVLIGAYISQEQASKELKKIRCNIAEDAYIREYSYYSSKDMIESDEISEQNSSVSADCIDCKPVACVCPKNKKHKRELEIGSALEFYKNSSNYSFKEK